MAYAHARIEDPETPGKYWEPGDEVSDADLERLGLDPEFGAVKDEEYNPDDYKSEPPQFIEIEGVRYMKQEAAPDA